MSCGSLSPPLLITCHVIMSPQVGLRQHFRQRKHEGMIGFRSFNLLDYCCKEELHEGLHTPLTLWSVIEAEISKRWYLRWVG